MPGEIEEDHAFFALFFRIQGFNDRCSNSMCRFRCRNDSFSLGKLNCCRKGFWLGYSHSLNQPCLIKHADLGRHAVIAQSTSVNWGWNEIVTQGEHFQNRRHFGGIPIIKSIQSPGERWRGCGFHSNKPRVFTCSQVLLQEGESNPAKIGSTPHTADHNIRIFIRHLHLLQTFLPDHSLMQEHMIQDGTEAVFFLTARFYSRLNCL